MVLWETKDICKLLSISVGAVWGSKMIPYVTFNNANVLLGLIKYLII